MKKRIYAVIAVLLIMSAVLSACSSKKIRFSDLNAAESKDDIISMFGKSYELTAGRDRMVYRNVRLIEALPGGLETKLQFFLDGENSYAFAYYVYGDADSNFEKVKAEFDGLYGESSAGEQENTLIWKKGDGEVSLSKMIRGGDSYIAAGMY